VTEPADVAP